MMGTTDPKVKPRPYESGSAVAEYNEAVTGDTAEAFGQDVVVPVVVTDPVRIEEYPARTITTDRLPIGVAPTRIVSAVRTRATVTIVARGGDAYIGGEGVTIGTGFLIPDGGTFTLAASCELYAVAAAAGVVTMHVLSEHRDG